jgi:hypothetical protein
MDFVLRISDLLRVACFRMQFPLPQREPSPHDPGSHRKNDAAEIHRGLLGKEVHRPLTTPIVLGKCEKSLAFLLVS